MVLSLWAFNLAQDGANGSVMQSSWIGWVAFLVLAAMVGITSCQANFSGAESAVQQAGEQ